MKATMKTCLRISGISASSLGLVLGLFALQGCGSGKKADSTISSRYIVPVEAVAAAKKHFSVTKVYSGPIEGEEQANIVSKLSERITAVRVRVGDRVPAGAVIIALDKSGTTSQYYQAEAGFKNAAVTLQRMKSLFSEGAISQQTLDGAQMAHDVAKANFEAAKSAVELSTPIAGIVTAINVNVGDLAMPGAIMATVARIDRMKIIFNMNETDIPTIELGQKVSVSTDANPAAVAEGRIVQLSKSADARSRSFEVRAAFPNRADRWYKPGMFGKVSIAIAPKNDMLLIPNAAIQTDGTTNRTFVVRNGKAMSRVIETGMSDGDRTVVLQGLAEGDSVATAGANNLKDSSDVSIVVR